jgi:hypothetical protein
MNTRVFPDTCPICGHFDCSNVSTCYSCIFDKEEGCREAIKEYIKTNNIYKSENHCACGIKTYKKHVRLLLIQNRHLESISVYKQQQINKQNKTITKLHKTINILIDTINDIQNDK